MSATASDIRDLRDTIIPKSDQLNADQLLGGPMTITVTAVRRGSGDEQPIVIHYEGEGGRPYKPCKSMRRVLMTAWGSDGSVWVGRSMTLFNRVDVRFGGQEVGGIRISHLSHIASTLKVTMSVARGKKEPTYIERLVIADPAEDAKARLASAASLGVESLKQEWSALSRAQKQAIDPSGCPENLKQAAQRADEAAAEQRANREREEQEEAELSGEPQRDPDTGEILPPELQ